MVLPFIFNLFLPSRDLPAAYYILTEAEFYANGYELRCAAIYEQDSICNLLKECAMPFMAGLIRIII